MCVHWISHLPFRQQLCCGTLIPLQLISHSYSMRNGQTDPSLTVLLLLNLKVNAFEAKLMLIKMSALNVCRFVLFDCRAKFSYCSSYCVRACRRSHKFMNVEPNTLGCGCVADRTGTGHDKVRNGANLRIRSPLVSFNHVTDLHFVTFSSSLYTTIRNPNPNLILTLTLAQPQS